MKSADAAPPHIQPPRLRIRVLVFAGAERGQSAGRGRGAGREAALRGRADLSLSFVRHKSIVSDDPCLVQESKWVF